MIKNQTLFMLQNVLCTQHLLNTPDSTYNNLKGKKCKGFLSLGTENKKYFIRGHIQFIKHQNPMKVFKTLNFESA